MRKAIKKRQLPSTAEQGLLLLLLDLFAEVDGVFEYADAFSHKNKSLGRIYRKWKEVRKVMDPDFNQHKYARRRYDDKRR